MRGKRMKAGESIQLSSSAFILLPWLPLKLNIVLI